MLAGRGDGRELVPAAVIAIVPLPGAALPAKRAIVGPAVVADVPARGGPQAPLGSGGGGGLGLVGGRSRAQALKHAVIARHTASGCCGLF